MPRRSKPTVSAVAGWVFATAIAPGCAWTRAPALTIPATGKPSDVLAYDLDADGEQEVLTIVSDQPRVGVHHLVRGGGWSSTYVPLQAPPGQVAPARHPNGGIAFVVAYPTLGSVATVRRTEAGWRHHTVLSGAATTGSDNARLLVADLDNDGFDDLVVATAGPERQLRLALGASDGSFGPAHSLPLNPATRQAPSLQAADLNLDGVPDLVCGMPTGFGDDPVPDQIRLFRGAVSGYLGDETWYGLQDPRRLAVGLVDADAWPDVVAFGQRGIWILYGEGAGWLSEATRVAGRHYAGGTLADIDGDGRDDIVAFDADRDRVTLLRSAGSRSFAPPSHVAVGETPIAMAIATGAHTKLLVTANRGSRDFSLVELSAVRH